jgi:hypothetical protein
MQRIVAALVVAGCVLVSPLARAGQEEAKETPPPEFILRKPSAEYLERLKAARASATDYFWNEIKDRPEGPTYENVKDFIAPIRYVNAPWRYAGVILSPKGSTQKMRVVENGHRIDANLTRRSPLDAGDKNVWAGGDTHMLVHVGPDDELFGLDEHRQREPRYEGGYLPVFQVEYESGGTLYEETVFAANLVADYRTTHVDAPAVAAYVRVTAKSGPGSAAFKIDAPAVGYGFPIVPAGFRDDSWTDGHNNVYAWFSPGGTYDDQKDLVRFRLARGESAYAVFPHQLQLAGTKARAGAATFEKARAAVVAEWSRELERGGRVDVPEKVVGDAYRAILLGNWQLTIGDEVPYGMFSYYQGNGYAETLQTIAPFIEYGYFDDARRFIQPILDYPLSDTGIGLHACANRLELAAYYFAMSGDAGFIRANRDRLVEIADYLLTRRDKESGLLLDGYGYDIADQRVVNINTNTNGWRAIRNVGLALEAIGDKATAERLLAETKVFGEKVRAAVVASVDRSTTPPFVPFALGAEKPHISLVESKASSYYNIVMPYFFESEIFDPKADPYTHALEYMWSHHGVMAGLNRFDQHSGMYAQDGIHPLYTWGRQFSQISRHEADRAVYTFYCSLAHGYTRGTYLTGEGQGTVPSEHEWYRSTYLPPEPPANALLLRSLRHILLHEHDREQDGIYDELWLLSSAPKGWLADGKAIAVDRMPTRFGPVSLSLKSAAASGRITGEVTLAKGAAGKEIALFVRVPHGYTVRGARTASGAPLEVAARDGDAVVTIPARAGTTKLVVEVGS